MESTLEILEILSIPLVALAHLCEDKAAGSQREPDARRFAATGGGAC